MIDYGNIIPSITKMRSLVNDEVIITDYVENISEQIRAMASIKKSHTAFVPTNDKDFNTFLDYEDKLKDIFSREGYSFRPSKTVENHWDICW